MIVTVINAEIINSQKTGEDVIRLEVLDDYETKRYMFIHPAHGYLISRLGTQSKIPVIHKGTYKVMNLDKLKHKLLAVEEKTIQYRGFLNYKFLELT